MTHLRTAWSPERDEPLDAVPPVDEAQTTDRFSYGSAMTGEDHRAGTERAAENLGAKNDGAVWPPDPAPVDNPDDDRRESR